MQPFTCQHCQHEFARTDGRWLVFGIVAGGCFIELARIEARTPLHCPRCRTVRVWRKVERQAVKKVDSDTLDTARAACYN